VNCIHDYVLLKISVVPAFVLAVACVLRLRGELSICCQVYDYCLFKLQ
jgi:hypothetical protein